MSRTFCALFLVLLFGLALLGVFAAGCASMDGQREQELSVLRQDYDAAKAAWIAYRDAATTRPASDRDRQFVEANRQRIDKLIEKGDLVVTSGDPVETLLTFVPYGGLVAAVYGLVKQRVRARQQEQEKTEAMSALAEVVSGIEAAYPNGKDERIKTALKRQSPRTRKLVAAIKAT